MEILLKPWPWYIAGPLLALTMFLLIMLGKRFGMSSNLRTLCTLCGAGRHSDFFKFDWKSQRWNLVVVAGVVLGGFIGSNLLSSDTSVAINPNTVVKLQALGFESAGTTYLPKELFDVEVFSDVKGIILLILGGLFVGFGARYAGGCTSGHAISGLSNLQLPSLIAVIGFFIGGLFTVHVLFTLIF
nr:YeeE/YedE thiosulfate transporter family protein [uncultured Allomuricauda sp.]